MKRQISLKKVAIFSHRHIGDTIFCEPIIKILERQDYEVTLFVFSESAQKISSYFSHFRGKTVVLKDDFFENMGIVKKGRYDIALLLNFSLNVALISFFRGIHFRFGKSHEARRFFLTKSFKQKKKKHASDLYYDTLDLFYNYFNKHIDYKRLYPQFKLSNNKQKIILFQVGTTRQSKKIPLSTYKKLIVFIRDVAVGYKLILCGDDVEEAQELEPLVDKSAVGKTNFNEYVDLIQSSQFLFSPDTSAIHIASASKVKVFGFYGSTSPKDYGPLSDESFVSVQNYDCMPCYKESCLYEEMDRRHMQCLKNVNLYLYLKEFITSFRGRH